eukprot:XP_011666990.1 PREDICTED: uncharacterized protein LOC105439554 [Strongylocentrotus purpuratus]
MVMVLADLLTRSEYSGSDSAQNVSENPVVLEHVNAATKIHEHLNSLLTITTNQDIAFQTLKTQLLEAQRKIEAFNNTSPTTTTSPSPKEKRCDSLPLPVIRVEPAGQQDSRGSIDRGAVNITDDTEIAAIFEKPNIKTNNENRGRSSSSVSTNDAQMRHVESSPKVNDQNLNRKAYGGELPSDKLLSNSQEEQKSRDRAPSPLPGDKMNAYHSSPKASPRTSSSPVIRRNVPQHLLSTTNQSKTSGQVGLKEPLRLPNKQASTNSAGVQEIQPKKLETLMATSSKPNKNTNAQSQPNSNVSFYL